MSTEATKIFAAVRPYGEVIRVRVFSFLTSMQLELGEGMSIPAGTPDDEAARTIDGLDFHLLLMPFHLHRDRDGRPVDGIGVAEMLSQEFVRKRVPILMPVSAYSERASFPRRLEELERKRPDVVALLVPMPESAIGSPEIRAQIDPFLR